jgi:hypothetical protein
VIEPPLSPLTEGHRVLLGVFARSPNAVRSRDACGSKRHRRPAHRGERRCPSHGTPDASRRLGGGQKASAWPLRGRVGWFGDPPAGGASHSGSRESRGIARTGTDPYQLDSSPDRTHGSGAVGRQVCERKPPRIGVRNRAPARVRALIAQSFATEAEAVGAIRLKAR